MGKRKHRRNSETQENDSSDEGGDVLDVDFEFFDPQPEHDVEGLKTLLRQLLDVDAQGLDLSALVDLILQQPLLGSTVKVEGNESDPLALLTVLNLKQHRELPCIQGMIRYLSKQAARNPTLAPIHAVLEDSQSEIGLLLTERIINMPAEVAPPMYRMLLEEIDWALAEREPYGFTHYLVLSKTYTEIQSSLDADEDDDVPRKKKAKATNGARNDLFHFHPEDEILQQHATAQGSVPYLRQNAASEADSKRAFQEAGIRPQTHMILIEADRLKAAITAMNEAFQPS